MGERTGNWTRRQWLWLFASSTIGGAALLRGQEQRAWGVQLYTVRDLLKTKAPDTLKAIAAIGYKEAELFGPNLDTLVPLVKQAGLTPVSTHVDSKLIMGDTSQEALDKAFDEIAKHGIKYALMAYIPVPERGKDAEAYKKFAGQMNRAGQSAKRAGLTFGYHNHAFEFAKLADGMRPIDIMLDAFDPALVRFEVDVFWVSVTGNDPVEFIKKLGTRAALLHLKDKTRGTPVHMDENVPHDVFAEVGAGAIDIPAVVKAGQAAGVQHYFVEQDYTPGDPLASLKKSYDYLSRLT